MKARTAHAIALAFVAVLLCPVPAAAEVYKWVDEDGVVHFTDTPPEDRASAETVVPDAAPAPGAAGTESAPAWYDQWLAEQRERKRFERAERDKQSAERGAEQARMLEACAEARRRLDVLETPCPAFFDGLGVLRSWCPRRATWAYKGEFRYIEDDERANMIRHYREQLEECEAAGY